MSVCLSQEGAETFRNHKWFLSCLYDLDLDLDLDWEMIFTLRLDPDLDLDLDLHI